MEDAIKDDKPLFLRDIFVTSCHEQDAHFLAVGSWDGTVSFWRKRDWSLLCRCGNPVKSEARKKINMLYL